MKSLKRMLLLPLLLLGSTLLQAHTALKEALPADGAVLNVAPTTLELGFSEEVQLLKVDVSAAGTAQDIGFKPSAAAARTFSLPLPALRPAAYTVNWTILGADGHRVEGTLGFTVDPAAAAAAGATDAHQGH